ncbi:MAG: GNAT family N-acetyltransferase [Eubacteriales bacterium]
MLDKSIPYFRVLMVKTDMKTYPRFDLPEGYRFSGYMPGFEIEWAKLMVELEQKDSLEKAMQLFQNEFLPQSQLLPKQCLFVLDSAGCVVASASIWPGEHFGKTLQRIHWVAASPGHQGKGLVKALMTKLLDVYNELGYKDFIYLSTKTWSYKAINIYENFGFTPYLGPKPVNWKGDYYETENKQAWQIIEEKIKEYERFSG